MVGLYLMIAGCVAALAGQTLSDNCVVVDWGYTIGPWKKIEPPSTLSPGIRSWKVPIPKTCRFHIGTSLEVCDYDVAPEGKFLDGETALVHRKGLLAGDAVVNITNYCLPLITNKKNE